MPEVNELADELEAMLSPWREHHEAEHDVEAGQLENAINAWFWENADHILAALRQRPDDAVAEALREIDDLSAVAATDCPSCHGLNTSCPDGCGRDPVTGEPNGTRLEQPTDEAREGVVDIELLLANLQSFDPQKIPTHKLGMWLEDNHAKLIAALSSLSPDKGGMG